MLWLRNANEILPNGILDNNSHGNYEWRSIMKFKLIVAVVIVIVALGGYWIVKGPKKEVSKKIQWSLDDETKKKVPIFLLHYKWNGIEESDPTWMIFPKEGKWWIVDLRNLDHTYSKAESDIKKEVKKYRQELTSPWIEKCGFEPKASRYEAVMTALGFNMLFSLEKSAFRDFLGGIDDFRTGELRPD